MTVSDRITFLQERTALSVLQLDTVATIARAIEVIEVPPTSPLSKLNRTQRGCICCGRASSKPWKPGWVASAFCPVRC